LSRDPSCKGPIGFIKWTLHEQIIYTSPDQRIRPKNKAVNVHVRSRFCVLPSTRKKLAPYPLIFSQLQSYWAFHIHLVDNPTKTKINEGIL